MINSTNSPLSQTADNDLNSLPTADLAASESSDQQLVQSCLNGDQHAWATLIRRYKNVMYFFARRYGASPADAADVFQLVSAELFVSLPRLRNQQSLRAWITTVSSHKAYHWKRSYLKRAHREHVDTEAVFETLSTPPSIELEQKQRDEGMRSAIRQLPPRCQELVRLLFYEDPPLPYETVASRLGLATTSVGLTRSRCLKRLERILDGSGLGSNGEGGAAKCAGCVHDTRAETP